MRDDPREIRARFNSVCAETGRAINKGDNCIYYPKGKKVFHIDSKQAEEYRGYMFDLHALDCDY
ncbi:MAG: hypothetical protein GY853_13675 [PVC group bacterium]|nr:hypothetical protein [PVC group bacterium]